MPTLFGSLLIKAARTIRKLIYGGALLLPFSIAAQESDSLYIDSKTRDGITRYDNTASCQQQIITGEQIRLSGYTRLSDILQLIDAAYLSTRNGYDWSMLMNPGEPYARQQWKLLVNGQRVFAPSYRFVDLNALGIDISAIERIVVVNTPDLYLGEFADKGLIHIITRKPDAHVTGSTSVNNNMAHSGDRSYTGYTGLHFRGQQWFSSTTLGYSDLRQQQPQESVISSQLREQALTLRQDLTLTTGKMTHQLQATLMQLDIVTNLPNHHGLYPFVTPWWNANYLGRWKMNERNILRISTSFYQGSGKPNVLPMVKLIHEHRIIRKKSVTRILVGNETMIPVNTVIASVPSAYFINPFVSLNLPLNRKSRFIIDLQYATYGDGYHSKTSLTVFKKVSHLTNWSFVAHLTDGSNVPAQLGTEIDFTRLGVPPFAERKGLYTGLYAGPDDYYNRGGNQAGGEFNYAINVGTNFKLYFSNGLQLMNKLKAYTLYAVNSDSVYMLSRYTNTSVDQLSYRFRFNIHYDVLRNVLVDFNYLHNRMLSGNPFYVQSFPRNKLSAVINWKLPAKLHLWTRLYYQSQTTWIPLPGYLPIATQSDPVVDSKALFLCDMNLSKTILREKIRVGISARNLLNNSISYNPYDLNNGMRLGLSLQWNL